METSFASSAKVYNSELGEFVDERHAHLAAVLQDYKATYSLVYIPQKNRDATDTKPWAILDSPPNIQPHIVRYMSDAEMMEPAKILQWVFEGDFRKHRPKDILNRIEMQEAAEALLRHKKEEDDLEDRIEQIAWLGSGGRDHKNTVWLGKGRKIER